jgi:hypothetical protein
MGAGGLGKEAGVDEYRGFPEPFLAPTAAVLAAGESALARAEKRLTARFGAPFLVGPVFPFDFTSYYAAETGPGAVKRFFAFLPGPASDLAEWKRWAVKAEAETAREDRSVTRPANIDPGCLSLGSLALASTKESPHRVYLGRGIWGELELLWNAGAFEPLPWTYADYRTPEALAFFGEAREALKKLRREALREGPEAGRARARPPDAGGGRM